MRSRRTVRALGALGALALALGLTACGEDDPSGATGQVSATEHNDADVAFASDMIQHHAQALSMVDLTLGRRLDRPVEDIVEEMRATQSAEIETMSDWLVGWDEKVPETMRDHSSAGHEKGDIGDTMAGMDADMPGMMTVEEMTDLQGASNAEFQDLWLGMMIEHHEGAVEMANAELADGRYEPTVDLAESIVSSQSEEIDAMRALLP